MKRRDFIKMGSFITVSVAALGVTACGSSAPSNVPPTVEGDAPNPVRDMPAAATGGDWKFPQSIASGDPQNSSIMLWTRVVPTSLSDVADSSATNVAVTLEVTAINNSGSFGTTTALTGALLASVTVPAYGDFDGTIRHKLTGLTANTTYFYQFVAGTVRSKVGRFKTAPAATSTADVKFAFMSCQDWSDNHWGAFSQIVADDGVGATPSLDFIVHLGDYIYETSGASTAEALHPSLTLPSGGDYAVETRDYRYLYKTFRSDTRLQALHERFPMIAVWDDHEFSDDSWQDHQTYGYDPVAGEGDNTNPQEKGRRRSANQAWFEYTPADISYSETNSTFQNIRIYRDLKFGQTVHLVMTDERLYRADHMIPESTAKPGTTGATPANQLGRINSRYLTPEASYKQVEAIKYGIGTDPLSTMTMLGTSQRQWWKDTMAGSSAKWKVWGNEVSLLRMGLNGNNALTELISLGIFGALTSSTESTGIAAIPAQVSTAVAPLLATPPATPATLTIVVALTPSLIGGGLPAANAQALASSVATAVAVSAAGGGDNTAKYTAAYNVLTGAGIPAANADALAQAAVGVFNQALAVGNLVIITAVAGAVGTGASQTLAGQAAYAITAKSASLTFPTSPGNVPAYVASLAAAGQAAGLNATQAQAAGGAFYNAIAVGNITIASAVAGGATANASTTVAAQAAFAITATDSNPAATTAARIGAAQAAGLTALQAETAVLAYETAKAALPAGASSQILLAANQIAFIKANPDIAANKSASPFYIKATGASAAAAAAFFQKFLLNADQWDGYGKERKELMNFLIDKNIKDVVAVTGDIHSFYAGQVYNDYPGEVSSYAVGASGAYETDAYPTGEVAMVDLVTAGISSTSWFKYIKQAVDVLDPPDPITGKPKLIGNLVYAPIDLSASFGQAPNTTVVNLNLLDYSMGKPAPASTTELAAQLNGQIKRILVPVYMANGVTNQATIEALLNGTQSTPLPSALAVQAGIALNPAFQSAFKLAETLANSVAANPWLKHVDTEAQGYAVVTASTSTLSCEFKKLNPLVGTAAPTMTVTSSKIVTITAGSTNIG